MKTAKFLLLGFFAIALLSCVNDEQTEQTNPIETTETDTTETASKTEEPEIDEVLESGLCYGIDISKYQGDEMELMTKNKDSLSFVICRSSEGMTYTDADFTRNWKEIKNKGFIRGAYHFYRSDDAPKQQAAHFLKTIGKLESSDFPPIIDFEEASIAKGANEEKVIEDLWEFIFIVEEKSGRKPIIYTDMNIGNKYFNAFRFANYPLWIANYSSRQAPKLPGAWKESNWSLWQKSDTYRYQKIENDFDVFNGNLTELKKFIARTVNPSL